MSPPFQKVSWREIAQKGPSLGLEVLERKRLNEHMAGALALARMHQREGESKSCTNLGF